MNTQQLECFVRVADKLNFTKAAEELYISTPAVTHHIKNLEEELNTTLFIRTSKMVKLTEAGALFYGEARDILQKMALAEKKVKRLASQKLSVLRIGCSSQAELNAMEPALARLRKEYPAVYPQIVVQDYFLLASIFANRQLDVLIGTREMMAKLRDHTFQRVRMVSSYAVVAQDSPLAGKEEIQFEELYDQPLITLHPRLIPFQYGNKLQEFVTLHAQKHFHLLCEYDQSALLLAKCGYGVAILPEICLPAAMEGIAAIPFREQQIGLEYGIACHKSVREPYVKQFVKWFAESGRR